MTRQEKSMVRFTLAWIAFVIALSVYCEFFAKPREVPELAILAIIFAFTLILMWIKKRKSLWLLLGLGLVPLTAMAPEPVSPSGHQPESIIPIVCGAAVIGGGAYAIFKLYCLAKKLDATNDPPSEIVPPPPPAVTNCPSCRTNTNHVARVTRSAGDFVLHTITAPLPPDTNSPVVAAWTHYAVADLQVSPDCRQWSSVYRLQFWFSASGSECAVLSNSVPVLVTYSPAVNGSYSNYLPVYLPTEGPEGFFRFASQ